MSTLDERLEGLVAQGEFPDSWLGTRTFVEFPTAACGRLEEILWPTRKSLVEARFLVTTRVARESLAASGAFVGPVWHSASENCLHDRTLTREAQTGPYLVGYLHWTLTAAVREVHLTKKAHLYATARGPTFCEPPTPYRGSRPPSWGAARLLGRHREAVATADALFGELGLPLPSLAVVPEADFDAHLERFYQPIGGDFQSSTWGALSGKNEKLLATAVLGGGRSREVLQRLVELGLYPWRQGDEVGVAVVVRRDPGGAVSSWSRTVDARGTVQTP